MKDIIELIKQRLNNAKLDDCISSSVHKDVMELVDKLTQLHKHSVMQAEGTTDWIRITDQLPPEHEKVLVQFGDQDILIGIMDSNNQWAIYWSDGIKADDPDRPIDYWMPLPA